MAENDIKNNKKKSNVKRIKLLIIDRKVVKKRKNPVTTKIIESLESNISLEVFWLLLDPELQNNSEDSFDFNYKDFEDYETTNTLKILKQEKPDLIIIYNDHDFKIRSFIPSAKKLKIPIVLLIQTPFFDHFLDKMNSEMMQERIKMVNQNFKTYLFNYFSMLKNYFQTHYNLFDLLKMLIHDFSAFFKPTFLWGRYDCDLILVPSRSWKTMLEKKNIKSKIVIVGLIPFDSKIKKIFSLKPRTNIKKPKLILLTTPFKEHGWMSTKNWEQLIKEILLTILPEFESKFDFLIKIHPMSENKKDYQKLIDELNFKIPILQNEDLIDVLHESDLVISYGYSGAMIDVLLLQKPLIIANFQNFTLNQIPFVQEELAIHAKNRKILKSYLENIPNYQIHNKKFEDFIEKYYYKMDGNVAKRASFAIIDLIKQI